MGNRTEKSLQKLSERVCLVANSDTWIEGKAIQQLEKTAELEGIVKAAGMPDLHPGRGYPIGAAFSSENKVYPALVGNDIGCGMSLWTTSIKIKKVNLDKFEKRLSNIDMPLCLMPRYDEWEDYIESRSKEKKLENMSFKRALGTIGGGNHFAELQQVDKVFNEEVFNSFGIDKKQLALLVHSGSRGLGESILRKHVEQFSHGGLEVGSNEFDDYMEQHEQALRFAELNRELIAMRMLDCLNANGDCVLDVNHNLVSKNIVSKHSSTNLNNKVQWIHRKGATPADQGTVMIPGSRGDYSYLVKPRLGTTASRDSLYSLAHGAGRKWIRSECKARLSNRYKKSDLARTSFGSRVICKNTDLIFEEAPEAYKSIYSVIEAMQDAELIETIARFKPVLTYKTQGGC